MVDSTATFKAVTGPASAGRQESQQERQGNNLLEAIPDWISDDGLGSPSLPTERDAPRRVSFNVFCQSPETAVMPP
jgi:hypothetical protein